MLEILQRISPPLSAFQVHIFSSAVFVALSLSLCMILP
jgi:hypothetical protein